LQHCCSRFTTPPARVACGALTETLLESELFGHEKGAFTNAQYRKKGSFEVADGGTVFLDEIGDISLKTQTDLLRVLQEREITRVGSTHPIHGNFRCIAATNKNVQQLVDEGRFGLDLFYHLNVFQIELPPLPDRNGAIPILAEHFIRKFSASIDKKITRISPVAMGLLDHYQWPGNVREPDAIERVMVVAQQPEIHAQDFALRLPVAQHRAGKLEDIEKAHIL
jgi:two-component system, NtrC family, response regulator HydG